MNLRAARLVWLTLPLLVALVAALVALQQLRGIGDVLGSVVADRVTPLRQLAAISDALVRLPPALAAQALGGRIDGATAATRLEAAAAQAARTWAEYLGTTLVTEEQALIAQAGPALDRAAAARIRLSARLRSGDTAALRAEVDGRLVEQLEPLHDVLSQLQTVQETVARREQAAAQQGLRGVAAAVVALLAISALAGAGLSAWLAWRDVRERRAAELAERRRAQFLAALSRTNQLIVRAKNERELFDEVCRISVEAVGARVAAVLRREGDRLLPLALAGEAMGPLADATLTLLDSGPTADSPTGTALLKGRTVVCNDYLNDPRTVPWREWARRHRILAMTALPIRRGGQVVAAFDLFIDIPGYFCEERMRLLEEMTGDISFALDNFDREARRLRAESEATEALARLQQVFELLPVAVTIATLDEGLMIEANPACARQIGLPREALIGRRLADLGVGLPAETRRDLVDRLLAGEDVRDVETASQRLGGGIRELLLSARRIDYQGRPCVLAAALDITERKHLEDERRARGDAEAASRAKTDFLAHMSHELRTPLNAVLSLAELLLAEGSAPLDERQRARVSAIRDAGWFMLALANDVLDISRIESGRLRVESDQVVLAPLAEAVFALLATMAAHHGVVLEPVVPPAAVVAAHVDPVRLRQVLVNLVGNAIKYNRPGGHVRVTIEAADAEVRMRIADNGLGMTAEQLAHLFEPYNRLGREHGGIEGTGIGLALTRRLVEMMGGRLDVQSQAGQGTTVTLTLPAAAGAPEAPAATAATEEAFGEPEGSVLYIEDNVINVMVVEEFLSRWPALRFESADTGADGIARARELRPDLVLLDMQLPDMDGHAVLAALRGDAATAALPVVALSGSALPDDVARARAAGVQDYWTKPLDATRFVADMQRMLAPTSAPARRTADAVG